MTHRLRARQQPTLQPAAPAPAPLRPRIDLWTAGTWVTLLAALLAASVLTWSSPAVAAVAAAPIALPAPPAQAALAATAEAADLARRSQALQRASNAVVGLRVVALDDARSAKTLGQRRGGSGVVIDADGLVLTIGYLVLEADQVQLMLGDGRQVPARVRAYDQATGFGLVQALAPLGLEPAPLGRGDQLSQAQPLMIATGGDDGDVSAASLVSRRAFAAYWEYHIEGALFTAPARRDHSGAGLFNGDGELVGIGSLFVTDTADTTTDAPDAGDSPRTRLPGNMFVPVDLLMPILDDLRRQGRSAGSQRAWLGLNCVEQPGGLRVVRVTDDSPADVAGLQPGDRILRIDGAEVRTLSVLWQSLWSGGAAEREVRLDIERNQQTQTIKAFSVDRAKTLKRPEGI